MALQTWRAGQQSLTFHVYPCNQTVWNEIPGLYIFCYLKEGFWVPLYVGQADSFKKRFSNHERFDDAVRGGATHIHAVHVANQLARDELERAMIEMYQPPLNTQHRGPLGGAGLLRSGLRR